LIPTEGFRTPETRKTHQINLRPIKGAFTIHSSEPKATKVGDWRKWLLHRGFRAGITLKGIDGILEAVAGAILWFVHASALNRFARIVLRHDLPFDRHEFVTIHLFRATQNLATARHFVAVYLVLHGVIKAALVTALWFDALWAYPLTIAVFAVFSGYQLYRFTHTHSLALLFITILDALIIYLTWWEYRDHKLPPHNSSQAEEN
jgi:uncharacterized membrane protein